MWDHANSYALSSPCNPIPAAREGSLMRFGAAGFLRYRSQENSDQVKWEESVQTWLASAQTGDGVWEPA